MRTDVVKGEADDLPVVGRTFCMTAPPLEFGDCRVVYTTVVRSVAKTDNILIFETRNSKYKLEIDVVLN